MNEEDPPIRDGGTPWVFSASSIDGMSWFPGSRVPLFGDGSGECQVARAGPGGTHLVMLARSQRRGTAPMGDDANGTLEHSVLFSSDGGRNWSTPTRLHDMPGTNCEASIVSLPPVSVASSVEDPKPQDNWTLLATAPSNVRVHDDRGGLLRAGLAMYASNDALGWQRIATIDANASAYSSLLVLPTNCSSHEGRCETEVLCLYEAGHGQTHDAPYGSIRLARSSFPRV